MKSEVTSKESLLGISLLQSDVETTYYSIVNEREDASDNQMIPLQIQFTISDRIQFDERSIYNTLDMLGDIGGLFDALCVICTVFLFLLSLITKSGPHNYIIKRVFKK